MNTLNLNSIITKVSDTENYTFNIPDVGDKVILLHNPYCKDDNNTIIVINRFLQQIGNLPKNLGFTNDLGNLFSWKPSLAEVINIRPKLYDIIIEIKIGGQ